MEYIDIYTKDRIKTGAVVKRYTKLKKGEYRLIVHVALFDEMGHMLIQKRSHDHSRFEDKWDISSGGGVSSGEDTRTTATRETFEELGIEYQFENEEPLFTMIYDGNKFDDYYIGNIPHNTPIVIQDSELVETMWATKDDIYRLIDKNEFVSHPKSVIDRLFEEYKSAK